LNKVSDMSDEQHNGNGTALATTSVDNQHLSATPTNRGIASPYSSERAFEAGWRMAKSLSASDMVPEAYRKKPENCLIALELASRIGISVLPAMQNLHIIQGRPSWSAPFLIATVNASGQFTKLRYEWGGKPGTDSWACRAVARERANNELCEGTWVTWEMAKKEGWTTKNKSKWLTMPQQMFMYRAAAFWCRVYCPEISMGFQTDDEVLDVTGEVVSSSINALPAEITPAGAKALEAVLGVQSSAPQYIHADDDEQRAVAEPVKPKALAPAPSTAILFSKNYPQWGGKAVSDAEPEDIARYMDMLQGVLDDPSKHKAHAQTRQHLDKVEAVYQQKLAAEVSSGDENGLAEPPEDYDSATGEVRS